MEIKRFIVSDYSTNCYLIVFKNEVFVVDPGGEADKILKEIKKTEKKLTYIINTHYHPDHTGENEELKEKTGAKILIHEKEKDYIKFEVDKFLKEGDKIGSDDIFFEVILTPGHTEGSICLLSDNMIFTGDTLFKDGYGRTDFPGGSFEKLQESLQRISKLLNPGTMVYPGHGEVFGV